MPPEATVYFPHMASINKPNRYGARLPDAQLVRGSPDFPGPHLANRPVPLRPGAAAQKGSELCVIDGNCGRLLPAP